MGLESGLQMPFAFVSLTLEELPRLSSGKEMGFCHRCGARVSSASEFCPGCGRPRGLAHVAQGTPSLTSEHIAGAVCYVFLWISGFAYLLFDRRPFVRFHAAQSTLVFGAVSFLDFAIGRMFGFDVFFYADWTDVSVGWLLLLVFHLLVFVLWLGCILKASQGQRFRIPLAAEIAQAFAGD